MKIDPVRAERYLREGFWQSSGIATGVPHALRSAAAIQPNKRLVVDRVGEVTYGEVEERVARAAQALRDLGLGQGDVVMIQLPNWHEALVVHLAVESLGGVTVPMPPLYRAREIRHIANLTEAKLAVLAGGTGMFDLAALYQELAPEMTTLKTLLMVDNRGGRCETPTNGPLAIAHYPDLLKSERLENEQLVAMSLDPDRLTEYGFTSGSTGLPKAVMHTSNTLMAEHRVWLDAFKLGPSDTFFIPATVGHQIGFTMMRAAVFTGGASIVFLERWDPAAAVKLLNEQGVTFTFTTPAFLFDVLAKLDTAKLPSVRTWVLAGQVVTSALRDEALKSLPHIRFSPLFGMTEMGCTIMCDLEAPESKLLCTGRPQKGVELDVIDPEERSVGNDSDGELVISCPGLFHGYHRQADATAASFTKKGFFKTGDQVRRDADGFVMITGRIKDLIKRGGESISPEEIEEVLARHPNVADVAIIGVPDARLGERICACIVVTKGATLTFEDLVRFAGATLPKSKWPERLEIVDDLPRTSINKVHKATLRARFAG